MDPVHPAVIRLLEARRRIRIKLTDETEAEQRLRNIVDRPKMKIETSEHYVLLHDTSANKVGKRQQSRAETRLELLERVYESYFMKFALDGVVLDPPKERMMIVLFGEESDFLRYSTQLEPELASAAGFWSPGDNVGVFYDQGSNELIKDLEKTNSELKTEKQRALGTAASRDVAHLSNTFNLLVKILKEEMDIEVVSHEATHQLAGNTGLLPRGKVALRWAHEGLASYFETSTDAAWGGIGAINDRRLQSYRRILKDPRRNSIEFLVSDTLFDSAGTNRDAVDAYGQAWALTHYLMENKFEKLAEYYRRTSEIDTNREGIPRAELLQIFVGVFGDLDRLDRDWRLYMSSLKTDMDRLVEAIK